MTDLKKTALLRRADPATLKAYAERIERGEAIEDVLGEVATDAANGPGATKRIEDKLYELAGHQKLQFDQGVFSIAGDINGDEAKAIAGAAIELANNTEAIGNMGRWVLGNIAVILEDRGFDLGDMVEPTQMAYNTIVTSATTFRTFRDRRFKLPFAHHKEIAYAKDIPEEGKYAILEVAEKDGLPLTGARGIKNKLQKAVKSGEVIENWLEAALAAAASLNDEPAKKPDIHILIGPAGLQVLDRKPSQEEVAASQFVAKIGRIVKNEGPTNGGGDAEEGVQEALDADAADGGAAPGEAAE